MSDTIATMAKILDHFKSIDSADDRRAINRGLIEMTKGGSLDTASRIVNELSKLSDPEERKSALKSLDNVASEMAAQAKMEQEIKAKLEAEFNKKLAAALAERQAAAPQSELPKPANPPAR